MGCLGGIVLLLETETERWLGDQMDIRDVERPRGRESELLYAGRLKNMGCVGDDHSLKLKSNQNLNIVHYLVRTI